jgi:multicomponent Na+:H+ antiporter subunit F
MTSVLFSWLTLVIVAISLVMVYRVAIAKTVFDRLLAAGAMGTSAIALLAVTGFLFERPDMFVDLALGYALLNFVGTVAVGKYLERNPESGEEEEA